MKLLPPVLDIQLEDGFAPNDKLGRKSFGKHLKDIFSQTNEPLVVILDAPWGEGKTTFIKMWQGLLLENPAIQSVYIDAFQSDHLDDPFIAITSAINAYAIEKEVLEKNSEFKKKAVKIGWSAVKTLTRFSIKAAALGALRNEDFTDIEDLKGVIMNGGEELVSSVFDEAVSNFEKNQQNIKGFQIELTKIAKKVSNSEEKPLLIIIDELDRCKPTYAVKMLETIKHLFHTKNVTFILAMHKRQLIHSISSVYGCDEHESREYLEKFINFEAKLPKVESRISDNDYERYVDYLYDHFDVALYEPRKELKNIVTAVCKSNKLSLRQIEKVFANIAIFYATYTDHDVFEVGNYTDPHIYVVVVIAVLKVIDPEYLEVLCKNKIDLPEFLKKLKLPAYQVNTDIVHDHLLNNISAFFLVLANCDNLEDYANKLLLGSFVREITGSPRMKAGEILPRYYNFINVVK